MKKILFVAFLALGFHATGQDTTIIKMEYFVDADPGMGNGTALNISPLENVSFSFDVDVSVFDVGYHKLYLRTRDNLGRWSITARRNIEVLPTQTRTDVVAGEYFIDEDPFYGNGNAIAVNSRGETILQNFAASLTGLEVGYHKLYGRFKDNNGNWSQTFRRNIEVINEATNVVVNGEYFFKTDNGFGDCTPVQFATPMSEGNFTFNIPAGQILNEADTIFVRVRQDNQNFWSLTRWSVVNTVLPLTWLEFTAQRKSETVLLHWQTANEINTDFFRVQRSLDGINFKDIGTVPAMHGSINNKYSYQDNVAGTGSEKFFYRLQQTDINSAFTFSKIIAVNKMDNNTSLVVYPNPFSEYLIIKSEHPHELAGAVLTLIDLSGRKMKKQTLSPLETQKVNLTGLSKGVYMVQISKRNGNELFKVTKD